jgi:hypothetical protein
MTGYKLGGKEVEFQVRREIPVEVVNDGGVEQDFAEEADQVEEVYVPPSAPPAAPVRAPAKVWRAIDPDAKAKVAVIPADKSHHTRAINSTSPSAYRSPGRTDTSFTSESDQPSSNSFTLSSTTIELPRLHPPLFIPRTSTPL